MFMQLRYKYIIKAGNNLELIKHFYDVASKRSKWKTTAGTGVKRSNVADAQNSTTGFEY